MSTRPTKGVFLDAGVYRRKRLIDAARLLPILGFFLFIMPAIFIVGSAPTASRWVFLFVVWVLLIFVAALISHALRHSENETGVQD